MDHDFEKDNTGKFFPIWKIFGFNYLLLVLVFTGFIFAGIRLSNTLHGLGDAIDLAGSERMRLFQIAFMLNQSIDEPPFQRDETLGRAKTELDRFEEILNALKDGSDKYHLADVTAGPVDDKLKKVILKWEDKFKPQFNAVIIAPYEDKKDLLEKLNRDFHGFVEADISEVVNLLASEVEKSRNTFIILQSFLAFAGVIVIIFSAIYVRRRVLKPIDLLMMGTKAVSGGDYGVTIKVPTTNELMLLSNRFNFMTDKISKVLNEMEAEIARRTQEVAETNSLMDSFFKNAPDAIMSIAAGDRTVIFFSPGAERIFGYSADEVLGKNVNMLMPEPYHSNHETYVNNYLDSGVKKIIGTIRQVKAKRKNGEVFDIDLSVSESITPKGRVFNGIIRDITARVESEQQMKKLNSAIEQSAESIVITNREGVIEYVNPAFERVTGYSNAEVIGKNPRILKSGKQSLKHYKEMWGTILSGNVWRGEFINKKKNGELFWEDVIISPIINSQGEITNFVALKNNISEAKKAEQTLKEKNRELEQTAKYDKTFIEISTLFSSSFDREHIIKEMLAILSNGLDLPCLAFYSYEEWGGKLIPASVHGATNILKQEFELGEGVIGQAAIDGKAVSLEGSDDFPLLIESGAFSVIPRSILVQPVLHQEKLMGVLVIASQAPLSRSSTGFVERLSIQLGIALYGLNQYSSLKELSGQLKQRGQEISRKNKELEEANRLKSEFLANMSHELRTPLNAIIGFSEILKDGVMGELSPSQKDYAAEIFGSGHHLLSLINDILDLSKIEAGKMDLEIGMVHLPSFLENSLAIVKERALNHKIKLGLEVGDNVGHAYVDERKYKQMIYNLLSNAVKFTPDGGSVWVRAKRVMHNQYGDSLEVSVTDTGIGVSEEDSRKLFKPFEQLDGSMSRKYEGTGLGLVMVKRLAELHGGGVGMTSKVGEGSCFTIWVPYKDGGGSEDNAAEAILPLPKESAIPLSQKDSSLVLIIEDNEKSAMILKVQLESEGYQAVIAGNAERGLELAARYQPDLITLDIMLPGMDGWEFLRKIREEKEIMHIPVVIVSIVADEEKGFSLGASDVLQKPVRKELLAGSIRRIEAIGKIIRRVLIIDDDPKGVEVIALNLENSGYEVFRAYGGKEGIEEAFSKMPDLIILDLMMPEITGFDVVNTLKTDVNASKIPIIILTAKLLTEDEKRTLSASVYKITQKGTFKGEDFIAEVRKAAYFNGAKTAPFRPTTIDPKIAATESGETIKGRHDNSPLVLVVEDTSSDSEILKLYLESAGYGVNVATNGQEALDSMQNAMPDLITLDLMMPGMDGFAFLDKKTADNAFFNIPVIIVSSIAGENSGLSLGANAYIKKPVKRNTLLNLIASILSRQGKAGKPRILLIDDDPNAIKIISSYFDKDSYEVNKAYGGEEGLEIAVGNKPDLIVLDLMMPEMNGFEVISRLKMNKATKNIPVIVLSAKTLTAGERETLSKDVSLIAQKGRFNKEEFLEDVKLLTNKRKIAEG